MPAVVYIRRKTVVNTDPQRRCYNGCNYSERVDYSDWEVFQEWDTADFARRVARSLRADHQELKVKELMASINTMVRQCAGLIDTKDVSDWENNFLKSVNEKTRQGNNTSSLSEAQVEKLEQIYSKHFSG